MNLEIYIAGILLAAVGGCATNAPDNPQGSAAKDETMACDREYQVGSNIPKVVCAPKTTEAERQRAIDDMRNTIKPGGTNPAGK